MPKDKSASHERIITAAKKEFLEKGFEKASMRGIAGSAGMTSAGLYRHFTDKEDMFAALVEPVLQENDRLYGDYKKKDYDSLTEGSLDSMWGDGADLDMMLAQIYRYFDEFKLLLCCSEGTRYANFLHDFVIMEQKDTIEFLAAARKQGIPVKEIKAEELHLLISAYVTAIFEVVVHDFPREDAEHYLKTLKTFFYPGWKAVLGL